MDGNGELLQCYNRGCGQKFNAQENKEDSCRHHPGAPFFHDAYKGWSCCNKKCTDFTEFLNIKGCTVSFHSNVKPPEPEKPKAKDIPDQEVIEVKPIVKPTLERPPFDTPLEKKIPDIAPSLQQQSLSNTASTNENCEEVKIGAPCQNGGCTTSYQGSETDATICTHHPGVPVFHEGLKFWTCCQKRTTDFNAFLNQVGCEQGPHLWKKKEDNNKSKICRWDYHQTPTHIIVSIYAKQYCIKDSVVKLNPIRLCADLVFPLENKKFSLDLELERVINVQATNVSMYGTKVEIKMKKAEPGSWPKLEFTKTAAKPEQKKPCVVTDSLVASVKDVDLSDL